jgi:hypothetical protein
MTSQSSSAPVMVNFRFLWLATAIAAGEVLGLYIGHWLQ